MHTCNSISGGQNYQVLICKPVPGQYHLLIKKWGGGDAEGIYVEYIRMHKMDQIL